MRVLLTVALILVLLEAILAFACYAGYAWLGGGLWGTLLVVAVALMLVAPWMGELRVEADSAAGALAARFAWWGAFSMRSRPRKEFRVRVLCVPMRFRVKPGKKRKPAKGRRARRAEAKPRRRPSAAAVAGLIPATLQVLVDLLLEAREVSVRIQAPVQNSWADGVLAAAIGERRLGSVDLALTGSGKRRVTLRYRIGILRGALALLYLLVQGRPWRLGSPSPSGQEGLAPEGEEAAT